MCTVKNISDLIHTNWDYVYNLDVFEAHNYISFLIQYNKKQEEEMKQWKNSH